MKRNTNLILSGILCGLSSLLGIVLLALLSLPYFSVSEIEDGEIVNEYWKSHYFEGGFGGSLIALFIVTLIAMIASGSCFYFAKKCQE